MIPLFADQKSKEGQDSTNHENHKITDEMTSQEFIVLLTKTCRGIDRGTMSYKDANAMAKITGKMIAYHRDKMNYHRWRRENCKIPFYES